MYIGSTKTFESPVPHVHIVRVSISNLSAKETISFEQKKIEKILEVKKTAREKMVTHKKVEKEKVSGLEVPSHKPDDSL
jgi:hypothetical protein